MKTWSLTPLDQLSQFRKPHKMKLILNHQSLWLPSLEIRDFDRSDQIALITINDFSKLQVFCNKIIFSYADSWNALNFFKSPWPTLTKAKIMFSSLFSVHHKVLWLVDVWGHGGTDETETFYERSSWQRITNFWWHKLFTQAFVFIIIATLVASSPASFS